MSHNDLPAPTGAPLFSESSQAKTPVSVIIGFVLSLAGLFVVTATPPLSLGNQPVNDFPDARDHHALQKWNSRKPQHPCYASHVL
jgi:hypothetical protein